MLLTRWIDRVGAERAVAVTLGADRAVAAALAARHHWSTLALVLVPWGLGCFACNSAQQARLGIAAPAFAPALMALNTSAIYLGQAAGAASGGWLIAHGGYAPLHWLGLAWMVAGDRAQPLGRAARRAARHARTA